MKKHLRVLVLVFAILPFTGYSQNHNNYKTNNDNPSCFEKRFYEKLLQGNPNKGVGDNYDLKYHRFNWYVDPSITYLSGSVTSYFVTKTASFTHIQFSLNDTLTVDSTIYHHAHVTFTHSNGILDINLGTSLPAGRLDSIKVYYQGNPTLGNGFGSFVQGTHNGVPIIWTLSEPYGASDWWPCKNILCDKIDSIDVIVTCPLGYRVASNGLLVSETTAGINKIFHWKHRYPIAAYLIAIAVTNYSYYTDKVPLGTDTLPMLNYVYPENLSIAQTQTAAQVPVLQLYDSLFGTYPFINEKYGHAEFGWGGGMEHQTMSFVINFGFELCAHEMAHQWYGDKVTCGSWHDIWINESFATFCEGMAEKYLNPGVWYSWKHDKIINVTSLPNGSVYCYDTTVVDSVFDGRLVYNKGALVLNMLRWKLGDSVFFQGMKGIIADPQLAYGYALTGDIRHHFELASGLNLTSYFNEWIYNQGYPEYTINCVLMADSSVQVTISQTQSDPSVTYFELPVPIRFKNATRDTILVFDNTYSGQSYVAYPGFKPDSAFFDPDLWLLCKLDTLTLIQGVPEYREGKISISPNPVDRIISISSNEAIQGNVEIYDLTGRICMHLPGNNQNHMTIDAGTLRQGAYFIKLLTSDVMITGKFIKL